MGCHLWIEGISEKDLETVPFLFRVYDYQTDQLNNYKEAENFVIRTLDLYKKNKFKGKNRITLAEAGGGEEDFKSDIENLEKRLEITLQRLKELFEKFPDVSIHFG